MRAYMCVQLKFLNSFLIDLRYRNNTTEKSDEFYPAKIVFYLYVEPVDRVDRVDKLPVDKVSIARWPPGVFRKT